MDELFEAILSNPFLLLVIIGGIISLFRGKSEHTGQKSQQPSSNPTRSQSYNRPGRETRTTAQSTTTENDSTLTVEEHRDEQMERLKDQLDTGELHTVQKPVQKTYNVPKVVHSHEKSYKYVEFKKDMKKNLTKRGLIDSIVMAEVLGPPRARKPYRSIIYERNNK